MESLRIGAALVVASCLEGNSMKAKLEQQLNDLLVEGLPDPCVEEVRNLLE